MKTKQYSIEHAKWYCDYIKDDITLSIKMVEFAGVKKAIEKRCNKWSVCNNRDYCIHGKI